MKTYERSIRQGSCCWQVAGTACNAFLDEEADNVFTPEQIFSDNALIESAIANLYGRVEWAQSFSSITEYTVLDEAAYGWGGPSETAQFFPKPLAHVRLRIDA